MKKKKKNILESIAVNKSIIFGILVVTFVFMICILPLINKFTHSSSQDSLVITCPEEASAGENVECSIYMNSVSMSVSGISAKYKLTDGIVVEGLSLNSSFSNEYSEFQYKDEFGFVLVNDLINGDIGLASFSIPSDAKQDDVYKIELINIVFADGLDNEIEIPDSVAEIKIKGNTVTPEPELSDVNTLDNITVTNGVFDKNFDKDINDYIVIVDSDTFNINITKTDSKSIVSEIQEEYSFGDNKSLMVEIIVTSESGVENNYSLTFIRKTDEYSLTFNNNLSIDNDKKYIKFVPVQTTGELLFEDILVINGNIKLYNKDNQEKDSSLVLVSGDILKIYSNDELKDQYVISVFGDSNGDGKIGSIDLVQARKHLVGYKESLDAEPYRKTGVYEIALDLNGDGNITTIDILKFRKIIAGVE